MIRPERRDFASMRDPLVVQCCLSCGSMHSSSDARHSMSCLQDGGNLLSGGAAHVHDLTEEGKRLLSGVLGHRKCPQIL